MGEKYDARKEIPNWNIPGCDLSDWTRALPVQSDCGEAMLVDCNPVVEVRRIKPITITECSDGSYLYDFGENCSGLTELSIKGNCGQHIRIDHGEWLKDGEFTQENLYYRIGGGVRGPKYVQRTEYICKGGEKEKYIPTFTYYGFRYAKVCGVTKEQATEDLLTYVVINTDFTTRGGFTSSDEVLNKLQEMTVRSDLANFVHFPTDCPHREKHGWTADAALSAEQMLMNFNVENNLNMCVKTIARAMDFYGVLPGIVPGSWGPRWPGPAWDAALILLPYYMAVLRDDLRATKEAAGTIMRYIFFLKGCVEEDGLIGYGLGDHNAPKPECKPSVKFTSSVVSFNSAKKAAYLFRRLNMEAEAVYCEEFASRLLSAIRKNLIDDKESMKFAGGSQTAQAMAIFYDICISAEEKIKALNSLVEAVHANDDHLTTGALGIRVVFRVLCDYGYEDLAYKMITRPDAPSYGFMIESGYTTLSECLVPAERSFNHHYFGDISALMIEYFGGIRINPELKGADTIAIKPVFPEKLSYVSVWHDSVKGKISVDWKKENNKICLELVVPDGITGDVEAPNGYTVNGQEKIAAKTGRFEFVKL